MCGCHFIAPKDTATIINNLEEMMSLLLWHNYKSYQKQNLWLNQYPNGNSDAFRASCFMTLLIGPLLCVSVCCLWSTWIADPQLLWPIKMAIPRGSALLQGWFQGQKSHLPHTLWHTQSCTVLGFILQRHLPIILLANLWNTKVLKFSTDCVMPRWLIQEEITIVPLLESRQLWGCFIVSHDPSIS